MQMRQGLLSLVAICGGGRSSVVRRWVADCALEQCGERSGLEQSRAERETWREGAEEETEGGRPAQRVFHHDYNRVYEEKNFLRQFFTVSSCFSLIPLLSLDYSSSASECYSLHFISPLQCWGFGFLSQCFSVYCLCVHALLRLPVTSSKELFRFFLNFRQMVFFFCLQYNSVRQTVRDEKVTTVSQWLGKNIHIVFNFRKVIKASLADWLLN